MACEKQSVAGSVSQRACVFCGSRVVLYPIADAMHLVHGPGGLRGLYLGHPRCAFLGARVAPHELLHRPAREGRDLRRREETAIGPDRVDRPLPPQGGLRLLHLHRGPHRRRRAAVCRRVAARTRHSRAARPCEGFRGTKKDGYKRRLRRADAARRHRAHRRASARKASISWAISTWPAKRG